MVGFRITSVIAVGIIVIGYTFIGNVIATVQFKPFSKSVNVDCFGLDETGFKTLHEEFNTDGTADETAKVKFWFSSRNQRERVEVDADLDRFDLNSIDFVLSRNTEVIVHGFFSNARSSWIKDMEDALLELEDVNVIVVNWASEGLAWNYEISAERIKAVGDEVGSFLHQIVAAARKASSSEKPVLGELNLICHGPGAHICGVAGHRYKELNGIRKLERITGLDPDQPCYDPQSSSVRLELDHATYVDIIFSNGELHMLTKPSPPQTEKRTNGKRKFLYLTQQLFKFFSSKIRSQQQYLDAHAHFYPNGGYPWHNCPNLGVLERVNCLQGRSYLYFTGSVIEVNKKRCTYWSQYWDGSLEEAKTLVSNTCHFTNCTEMGIHAIHYEEDQGNFYARVSESEPYCEMKNGDFEYPDMFKNPTNDE